mmetsp:Transcript_30682/g.35263  ORF Transcript_30682/g.35263 Transcript_30682/m.35263 type:complete len:90 (+) Transcript_30682:70-339(+)
MTAKAKLRSMKEFTEKWYDKEFSEGMTADGHRRVAGRAQSEVRGSRPRGHGGSEPTATRRGGGNVDRGADRDDCQPGSIRTLRPRRSSA